MLGMATMMAERRGFASGIGTPSVRRMSSLTLNGEPIRYDLDGDMPLLFALREASNLTGTKYGCDDGSCHACTVIIDGKAERSCQWRLRELEGAVVTTIEGLPANGHAVQRAWEAEMVSLCGYCEPGLIMAAVALLETNGDPSDEDLAAIPNPCPCGIGHRARKAIKGAAAELRRQAAPPAPAAASPAESAQPLPESDNLVQQRVR